MTRGRSVRRILLAAAQLVDSGASPSCCHAIHKAYVDGDQKKANYDEFLEAHNHFSRLFDPNSVWEWKHTFWNQKPTPTRQKLRVLCLLFAAHAA